MVVLIKKKNIKFIFSFDLINLYMVNFALKLYCTTFLAIFKRNLKTIFVLYFI